MKITVWTWKDEKWSADKETLNAINKMIKKKEKPLGVKWIKTGPIGIGDKIFIALGWVAMSPFILVELVITGFKCLMKKIKNGKDGIEKS
jgi:hypothetical protein